MSNKGERIRETPKPRVSYKHKPHWSFIGGKKVRSRAAYIVYSPSIDMVVGEHVTEERARERLAQYGRDTGGKQAAGIYRWNDRWKEWEPRP